jgi:hypothetical protein
VTEEELYAHPGWEWCTFEGARKQVLLLGLQSTFREKLAWLEEAESLALRMRIALPPTLPGEESRFERKANQTP